MEDAHLIMPHDEWGFFGVFDGHGGSACSKFVAQKLREELEKGCPEDDAAVKKMMFGVDQAFLDTEQASGSTATMCIVHKPEKKGDKHRLRVINAGDSRVLLGRRDGTIVDGNGTDKGLTTDHKPDHPVEHERIYRCGGTVECKEGNCARVNGDLAVSRGFGDATYKKTGGPGPEDRPVTCDPELVRFECDESDFLLLVCDGVSEGNFPNEEVVKLVAEELKAKDDPGAAARAVCFKAEECNSKDNITCMVVLLEGHEKVGMEVEFIPGPISSLGNKNFKSAYESMATRADMTLAQAAEKRYEIVCAELEDSPDNESLKEEKVKLGQPAGEKGSEERAEWFQKWVRVLPEEKDDNDMMSLVKNMGGLGGLGDLGGLGGLGDAMGGPAGKGAGRGGGKGAAGKADAALGYSGGAPPGGGSASSSGEDMDEKEVDGYSWSQNGEDVQITFPLPKPVLKKSVNVTFKPSTLQVAVDGDLLLDGSLCGKVEVDECTWCLPNGGRELQVTLTKQNGDSRWQNLLK
eukprot:gnl/TRDRNA2_/TRDRNA2_137028_c0_seq2.p1 gnl/TRDRNA2_/TRDRNA2_137028_c0~~gnl/TRDRNA2_/TRDRNA2_137028_c0_seq2.p1  ORF type:complete len:561 (+),score=138.59 gnl/TRDRNA2_/TRDRNA2_137028_c0_seq2:125-1684(+)